MLLATARGAPVDLTETDCADGTLPLCVEVDVGVRLARSFVGSTFDFGELSERFTVGSGGSGFSEGGCAGSGFSVFRRLEGVGIGFTTCSSGFGRGASLLASVGSLARGFESVLACDCLGSETGFVCAFCSGTDRDGLVSALGLVGFDARAVD